MDKPDSDKKEEVDRRQDHARRLRIAVRRAHDPLFTPLKERGRTFLADRTVDPKGS